MMITKRSHHIPTLITSESPKSQGTLIRIFLTMKRRGTIELATAMIQKTKVAM